MGRARYGLSIFLCLASAIPIPAGWAADQAPGSEQSSPSRTPSVADVQDALVWTGDFDGMVDGKAGSRTKSAIKAFQKSRGYEETGVLTIEEWNGLSAAAEAARDRVGWTPFVDRDQHWSVSYPAKQLKRIERPTPNTVLLRSDDNAYRLEIGVALAQSPNEIEAAFGKETSAGDGRTITYARKTDGWYVVTGAKAGQDFYLKAIHCAGAEFTLRFSWPTAKRAEMQPVVVAMVNSLVVPENLAPLPEVAARDTPAGKSFMEKLADGEVEVPPASLPETPETSEVAAILSTAAVPGTIADLVVQAQSFAPLKEHPARSLILHYEGLGEGTTSKGAISWDEEAPLYKQAIIQNNKIRYVLNDQHPKYKDAQQLWNEGPFLTAVNGRCAKLLVYHILFRPPSSGDPIDVLEADAVRRQVNHGDTMQVYTETGTICIDGRTVNVTTDLEIDFVNDSALKATGWDKDADRGEFGLKFGSPDHMVQVFTVESGDRLSEQYATAERADTGGAAPDHKSYMEKVADGEIVPSPGPPQLADASGNTVESLVWLGGLVGLLFVLLAAAAIASRRKVTHKRASSARDDPQDRQLSGTSKNDPADALRSAPESDGADPTIREEHTKPPRTGIRRRLAVGLGVVLVISTIVSSLLAISSIPPSRVATDEPPGPLLVYVKYPPWPYGETFPRVAEIQNDFVGTAINERQCWRMAKSYALTNLHGMQLFLSAEMCCKNQNYDSCETRRGGFALD